MRRAFLASATGIMLIGTTAVGSADDPGTADTPDHTVDVGDRALYGFPTDAASVAAAQASGNVRWGTPLTDDEAAQMDARNALVGTAANPLGGLEHTDWFAGARLEHRGNGQLVIRSTDPAAARKWADDALPTIADRVGVEPATRSYDELDDLLHAVSDAGFVVLNDGTTKVPIHSAAIDNAANGVVAFTEQDLPESAPADPRMSLATEPAPQDSACSSRTNCEPRGGVSIAKGSADGSIDCTLGFTVRRTGTTDLEFWTAGHCGHSGSNSWYNSSGPYYGSETYISDYENGSKDYMRVELSDSWSSFRRVYGESELVAGWEWPVKDSPVCASLGKTKVVDCGSVKYEASTWVSSTNGRTMYGAQHQGISTQGGDSGAPVYRDAGSTLTAIGIHNTSGGNFTRVWDIAGTWYPG